MWQKFLKRADFSSYDDFKRNYEVIIPDDFNFAYDVVDEWAKHDFDKPALVWINDAMEEKRFSFGEISQYSNRAANIFSDMGIKKGDSVMLMLKQRWQVWVCMLALHKIGAICIPATFQLTAKDIIYRCDAASVKLLITADDPEIEKHFAEAAPGLPGVMTLGLNELDDALALASDVFERPVGDKATTSGDMMLIYFSSGTTGMPKMVYHDYTYPLGHIVTAKYWQHVEDGGLHLTMSDSGWAKFGWGKIYGQWICGAVIVAYDTEKFVPKTTLEVLSRLKLTTFCAPPTIYRFLIQEDLTQYDFSTLRHCTIAGEPLNPEVYHQFKRATGLSVMEGFGQSETSVLIGNFGFDPVKPGSTGKPSPLYEVDLIDENGKSCEDGIEGSIVVRNTDKKHPTGLFKGYWRDEKTTQKCWSGGVYNTGDVAWRDADGYYWFVGRNDDVIKCSGYRIGPFEVESALLEHEAVVECAVTAAPDAIRGQVVKATVVLAAGHTPSPELTKALQNHVKKATAPYKYPRIIEYVDELPKTVSGKIRRGQIRADDATRA